MGLLAGCRHDSQQVSVRAKRPPRRSVSHSCAFAQRHFVLFCPRTARCPGLSWLFLLCSTCSVSVRAPSRAGGKCGHGVDSAVPFCGSVGGGQPTRRCFPGGRASGRPAPPVCPAEAASQGVPETPGSLDGAVRQLFPRTPGSVRVMDKVGSWMK